MCESRVIPVIVGDIDFTPAPITAVLAGVKGWLEIVPWTVLQLLLVVVDTGK
jgi:hypothetical protein